MSEAMRDGQQWTGADRQRLRRMWGRHHVEEIAAALGRTPTTVYFRAVRMRLGAGCSRGFEYLTAAEARTGFDRRQLLRVLNAAGVAVHLCMQRPGAKAPRVARRYVKPAEVDRAVALL